MIHTAYQNHFQQNEKLPHCILFPNNLLHFISQQFFLITLKELYIVCFLIITFTINLEWKETKKYLPMSSCAFRNVAE